MAVLAAVLGLAACGGAPSPQAAASRPAVVASSTAGPAVEPSLPVTAANLAICRHFRAVLVRQVTIGKFGTWFLAHSSRASRRLEAPVANIVMVVEEPAGSGLPSKKVRDAVYWECRSIGVPLQMKH